MKSIYSVFYNKLPKEKSLLLPEKPTKLVTFLNPYYIETLKGMAELYEKFDYICSDGILPVWMNQLWGVEKTERISFDMTSLAKEVFEYCSINGDGIYFIGSEVEKIDSFINVIRKNYPFLNIKGWHHGYIKERFDDMVKIIMSSKANVVIIGMGAPIQDQFAVYLKDKGFSGCVYTCGGFFHQTTERLNYYPEWINNWNLRTLYRLIHERYVWGRVFRYYPRFIVFYSMFLFNICRNKG